MEQTKENNIIEFALISGLIAIIFLGFYVYNRSHKDLDHVISHEKKLSTIENKVK